MSFEKRIKNRIKDGEVIDGKIDISTLRYFWQANPLSGSKINIPKFLRKIDVLKNFSDNELRILTRYMHFRSFENSEHIFKQGDLGIGLYFIYSGHVDIVVEEDQHVSAEEVERPRANHIVTLEKFEYFGELALLQERSARNATVLARDNTELIGLFRPDVEDLIKNYPGIASKLLQTISTIIANRLFSITKEVRVLKHRIKELEK